MGVSTNYSAWFGAGTASTAVLTPAQVAAVAPLVRVTAAYVVMYYAFCFFQSWSKLYLSASRRPSLFFPYVDSCSCASSLARRSSRLFAEAAAPPPTSGVRGRVRAPPLAWRGGSRLRTSTRGVWEVVAAMACRVRHREIGTATPPHRLGWVGRLCARCPHTPSTREAPYAIDATPPTPYAIDAITVINKTQAADAAAERRRQEADARAAQVWWVWLEQDTNIKIARR